MSRKKWRKKVNTIANLLTAIAALLTAAALVISALAQLLGRGG